MTDDDELLASLRRIAEITDPEPDLVAETARAALSTRRLDEELAVLLTDSALAPEVVRADDDVRLLYFESAQVSVELQTEPADGRISVRGLVSGARGEIVLESAATRRSTMIDSEGWFTFLHLPHGIARIHLRDNDGRPVVTSWVRM